MQAMQPISAKDLITLVTNYPASFQEAVLRLQSAGTTTDVREFFDSILDEEFGLREYAPGLENSPESVLDNLNMYTFEDIADEEGMQPLSIGMGPNEGNVLGDLYSLLSGACYDDGHAAVEAQLASRLGALNSPIGWTSPLPIQAHAESESALRKCARTLAIAWLSYISFLAWIAPGAVVAYGVIMWLLTRGA
jgi:hypothetical protein